MKNSRKYIISIAILDALAIIGVFALKPLAKLMIDYLPDCFFVMDGITHCVRSG